MSRWRLSTVRTLGGHDIHPSLFRFAGLQTLGLSRSRFVRPHRGVAIPVANLIGKSNDLVVASSSVQSHQAIEDRDSCRVLRTQSSYSAIETLKRCLSSENVLLHRPLIYSPTTLRSLYYRAESRNQLGMLDSRMLTILIGLFGSLSIGPCKSAVYGEPLESRFLGISPRRTHWAFVLKVGRYKLKRGLPLQDSDRFWLMRAELAIAQSERPFEPLSGDAYNAILRARTHYHIIRRHSRHPELHTHYLEPLLANRDPRLLNIAACDLSFLLRTHRVCHPRLQRLLYRLVIQHGELLSTRSQEAILAALWSRSRQGTKGTTNLTPGNDLLDIALGDYITDMITVARLVSTTLFNIAGHLNNNKLENSFYHLFSVFSPAYALPLRWRSLVFFSIFNSSGMLHSNEIHCTNDHMTSRMTSCWQVVFGLATIEKIISHHPSSAPGVLETTRTLCQLWLSVMQSCIVSRDLACAVAISFLKITSVLADAALFHDCQALCPGNGPRPHPSVQKLLATQYIAAAVRVQCPLSDVVRRVLEDSSLDLKQQREVLASAVGALAPMDAPLAYTLYTVAKNAGIELDPGPTHALAMSLAQHGAFHQAILLLTGGPFSLEKRGIVMSAIARSLRENSQIRHSPTVFVAIVNELAALYHSHVPPEHFRGHLEHLFVVLAQRGRGSQLFPVMLSIFKGTPNFFHSRFFVRYFHVLIQHRQFSTASKLLEAIAVVYPKTTRSLCILANRITIQTKAFQMSKRIASLYGPVSLRLSHRLRRHPYAGPQLGILLQELLKSGRVRAAKRTFTCAAATISSRQHTAFGNILLHGVSRQCTSRNGRCVRKVLALLENLVQDHGFRPDRVTANILIKVMINWRPAFDSPRLRELFDQLVRGGYPAADYSPLHLPFGTRQSQLSDSPGLSKLPPFVSFEKHTRPLFKMFIKAFHLCNDVEAAKRVVGILKVEEHKNAVAKGMRQKARSKGRVKVDRKNVIPLNDTISSND